MKIVRAIIASILVSASVFGWATPIIVDLSYTHATELYLGPVYIDARDVTAPTGSFQLQSDIAVGAPYAPYFPMTYRNLANTATVTSAVNWVTFSLSPSPNSAMFQNHYAGDLGPLNWIPVANTASLNLWELDDGVVASSAFIHLGASAIADRIRENGSRDTYTYEAYLDFYAPDLDSLIDRDVAI